MVFQFLQMIRYRLADNPDLARVKDLNGNSLLLASIYLGDPEADRTTLLEDWGVGANTGLGAVWLLLNRTRWGILVRAATLDRGGRTLDGTVRLRQPDGARWKAQSAGLEILEGLDLRVTAEGPWVRPRVAAEGVVGAFQGAGLSVAGGPSTAR